MAGISRQWKRAFAADRPAEPAPKCQMSQTCHFHQRSPDRVNQLVPNQEPPKPVRAFIEVTAGEISGQGWQCHGPSPPDGCVRKPPPVKPVVTQQQFFGGHVLWLEDNRSEEHTSEL